MDLKEIGINTRNWFDSPRDRNYWRTLVNASLNSGFHKPWIIYQHDGDNSLLELGFKSGVVPFASPRQFD